MGNYAYYTPIALANELLGLVEKKKYKNAIDICCGSWNLLKAAKNRSLFDKAVGLDVDGSVCKYMPDYCDFMCMDGRGFSLRPENIGKFDLVLSNPPFGRLEDNNRIMRNRICDKEIKKLLYKRYEIEMLIANMLLLKENGVMLAILPHTIVYGIKYKKIREYIAKHYFVKAIIDLPDGVFEKRDISTIAILIENKKNNKDTMTYTISKNGKWKMRAGKSIRNSRLLSGDWMNENSKERRADIYRGKIGSNYFDENGNNIVLHCSSLNSDGEWKPSIKRTNAVCKDKFVHDGDVIINRVGRGAGYWTINTFGTCSVSDCLIVISKPSKRILEIMRMNSDCNRLILPIYGVTTKYILQSDVCKLLKCAKVG